MYLCGSNRATLTLGCGVLLMRCLATPFVPSKSKYIMMFLRFTKIVVIVLLAVQALSAQQTAKPFEILAPKTKTSWAKNEKVVIRWQAQQNGNVQVDLYKAGQLLQTLEVAALSMAGTDNQLSWVVPPDAAEGTDYQIKLTNANNQLESELSANFGIKHQKKIKKGWLIGGTVGVAALIGAIIMITSRPAPEGALPDPPNPNDK